MISGMYPKTPACVAMFSDPPLESVWKRLTCAVRDKKGNAYAARIAGLLMSHDMLQAEGARAVDFQLYCYVDGRNAPSPARAWDRVQLFEKGGGKALVADAKVHFLSRKPPPSPARSCAVRVCTQAWGDGNLAPGGFTHGWLAHLRALGVASVVVNAVGDLLDVTCYCLASFGFRWVSPAMPGFVRLYMALPG